MIEVLGMAELAALSRPMLSSGWIVNDHWHALGRSIIVAMLCFVFVWALNWIALPRLDVLKNGAHCYALLCVAFIDLIRAVHVRNIHVYRYAYAFK